MTGHKTRNTALMGCLLAAVLLCSCYAGAQTITGSVTGEVTDSTGAIVPKAAVTVESTDTGVKTPAMTNAAGVYTVRFLPIGKYRVTIVAPGFSSFSTPVFSLEIDQTVKLNAVLTVGGGNTNIDVEADVAPILNTTDGSLGIVVTGNEIQNLPLNGRNFSSVTLFQPGAVNTDPNGMTTNNAIERETTSNGSASINGNRLQANNYTLDGIDMNEVQNNLIGYNPAPDAIGEIKVISANAPATYGNVNGGAVISVLKSGTNHFHGSAYGYLENYELDANSWSNKHNAAGSIIGRNPFTQSIFGGTFGGPVRIPHLFDGPDKLFFFGDYEGARKPGGGFSSASVFTQDMRNGNFSAVSEPLYNSQNNFAPYVNNQVPITNPVAKYLFAHPEFYPLPNTPASTGTLTTNNYQGPVKGFVTNNQFDVKIEYDPRKTDKITGFYAQSRARDGQTAVLPIEFPGISIYPSTLGGGTWVHTFSNAIVNEARLGFTRVNWGQGVPFDATGAFGLNGDKVVGIPVTGQIYPGFAFQNITGNSQGSITGFGNPAAPQIFIDNTFTYGDNLTIQKGRHLLSMGVTAIRYQEQYTQSQNAGALGSFIYNGVFTSNPVAGTGGYGPADFVADFVDQAQVQIGGEFGNRQWRTAGFFQDDWKVSPKLTVNLGLRYEYDQPMYEVHDRTGNVLPGGIVEYAGSVPAGAPAGSIVCPNRACYKANYKQFMPRLGFAYQISPRFVVRGGYGASSFFEGDDANQRLTNLNPFVSYSHKTATAPTATSGGQAYTVEQGYTSAPGDLNASGAGYGQWPQNIQPAYIQEYNLTTEYALNSKTSITVGYVGETGQHIGDFGLANQLTTAQAADIGALPAGAPIPAADQAPYANLVGQGGTLLATESRAMMNYNALQATVRQRQTRDLEYTVNYTYARAMTNHSGNFGVPNIANSGGAFQNFYDSRADYGPAGQDVRHNASAIVVYAFPVGRGKRFGSGMNRLVDEAVGGWSLSSTFIGFTGVPVTLNDNNSSNTNNYYSVARPNQYRHMKIVGRNINNWWGTDPSAQPCTAVDANNNAIDNGVCAYGQTGAYTFGTAAIGTERAPGFYQIDSSLFKDFHIIGEHSVGFRADIFNLLNVADYGNPDAGIQDGTFGQITSVRNLERRIQLSLNYKF